MKNITLRKSCYECKSKSLNRVSDITLADFWGIKEINPQVYNKKGVSAILVNTQKGSELLKNENLIGCDAKRFFMVNSAYNTPVIRNEKTQQFWDLFNKKGFNKATKQVYKKSLFVRLKTMIKYTVSCLKRR